MGRPMNSMHLRRRFESSDQACSRGSGRQAKTKAGSLLRSSLLECVRFADGDVLRLRRITPAMIMRLTGQRRSKLTTHQRYPYA